MRNKEFNYLNFTMCQKMLRISKITKETAEESCTKGETFY